VFRTVALITTAGLGGIAVNLAVPSVHFPFRMILAFLVGMSVAAIFKVVWPK